MIRWRTLAFLGAIGVLAAWHVRPVFPRLSAQGGPPPAMVNWALHNLDLAGSRFSPLDQINPATSRR